MKHLFVLVLTLTLSSSAFAGKNYDAFLESVGNAIGPTIDSTLSYWDQKFQKEIHPFLIKNYKSYYKYAGSDISDLLFNAYVFWEPVVKANYVNTKDYWSQRYPGTLVIPSTAKKSYEAFINVLWKLIGKYGQDTPGLTDNIKMGAVMTNMLLNAQKPKTDSVLAQKERRMNLLLNQLRPYVEDTNMASCYHVHLIHDDIVNSFNTGCRIYITEIVVDNLSDDELRAVLAHELAHGDHGDSIRSFIQLLQASGKHFSLLILDELDWLATSARSKRLADVASGGNLELIVNDFGSKAPAIETAADLGGVKILERSGHSKENLKQALIRLYELSDISPKRLDDSKHSEVEEHIRKYPTLNQRLLAIDSVK